MALDQHSHSGVVSVEYLGQTVSALYQVDEHVITVITNHAKRSMALKSEPIQLQAKEILLEMIRDHLAEPEYTRQGTKR